MNWNGAKKTEQIYAPYFAHLITMNRL